MVHGQKRLQQRIKNLAEQDSCVIIWMRFCYTNVLLRYEASSCSKRVTFFCWTQIFWRMLANKQLTAAIDFHSMEKKKIFWRILVSKRLMAANDFYSTDKKRLWKSMAIVNCFVYQNDSLYLILCLTEERHSYRFGTSWGWVNNDTIMFWVIAPFKNKMNSG